MSGNNKCHILFSHRGGNWIRGSERVLIDLIKGLDKDHFTPIVWCNWEVVAHALDGSGVLIHVSPTIIPLKSSGTIGSPLTYFSQIRLAIHYIRKYNIDVIHCNNLESMQWMLPAAKFTKTPILCHLHMCYTLRERCLFALNYSDYVVGCSKAVLDGLKKDGYPGSRLKLIYSGVPLPIINNELELKDISALGIKYNADILAVAGVIEYSKGFDIAIDTVSILHGRGRKVHLLIIGDGRDRESLIKMTALAGIKNYVHFLGSRTHDDVIKILSTYVDITLITSRYESLSLVSLESQAVGVPVVAVDVGGISETIQHQESGIVVSDDTPQVIANAIEGLLSFPERRKHMGWLGQKRIEQDFSTTKMVDEFAKTYDMLMQNRFKKKLGKIPCFLCLKSFVRTLKHRLFITSP